MNKRLRHFASIFAFLLTSISTIEAGGIATPAAAVKPNEARANIDQIVKILEISRHVLPRPAVQKFFKDVFHDLLVIDKEMQEEFGFDSAELKTLSETQFILLLLKNMDLLPVVEKYIDDIETLKDSDPQYAKKAKEWQDKFRTFIKDNNVLEKFKKFNDPLQPLTLRLPNDKAAFGEPKIYFTHPTYENRTSNKLLPADNLKQKVIEFISRAKKELIVSVFDFDLKDVAEEMIKAVKRGVKVDVMVDDKVIEARPEVQEVMKMLKKGGANIVRTKRKDGTLAAGIDSPGLHHHKLLVRDWSTEDAETAQLSGNLTQSCMGEEGDAVNYPKGVRPEFSVPNHNHGIFVSGRLMANIVYHDLAKLSEMNLRGASEFPLGGAVRIIGANPTPKDPNDFVWTTTPNGALKNVGKNFISRWLRRIYGPVGSMIFAFASPDVGKAILDYIERELMRTGKLDFLIIGDTPFSMMDWSILLEMSGQKLIEVPGTGKNKGKTVKKYVKIENNEWEKVMGPKLYKKFIDEMVRIAPLIFGNHQWIPPDSKTAIDVTAKIHDKDIFSETEVITGSFNFSEGALTNDEYIALWRNRKLAQRFWGALRWLNENSPRSVYDEAQRRNKLRKAEREDLDEAEGKVARLAAAKPGTRLDIINRHHRCTGILNGVPTNN